MQNQAKYLTAVEGVITWTDLQQLNLMDTGVNWEVKALTLQRKIFYRSSTFLSI